MNTSWCPFGLESSALVVAITLAFLSAVCGSSIASVATKGGSVRAMGSPQVPFSAGGFQRNVPAICARKVSPGGVMPGRWSEFLLSDRDERNQVVGAARGLRPVG